MVRLVARGARRTAGSTSHELATLSKWLRAGGIAAQSSTLALQRFTVGQGVYCMRSSGEESIGFIVEYDASTGIYKVELEVDHEGRAEGRAPPFRMA